MPMQLSYLDNTTELEAQLVATIEWLEECNIEKGVIRGIYKLKTKQLLSA